MRTVLLFLALILLAGASPWGCGTDRDGGPRPTPEDSFLRQIDHGCQAVDEHDPPPVNYYCHVADHGWQADTLSIAIAFKADCCVGFVTDVLIEGMSIDIAVRDTVIECDCVCSYRNDFLFLWREPGEVALTFTNVSYFGQTRCVLDTMLVVGAE